jgi:DNA replication protein DnaC
MTNRAVIVRRPPAVQGPPLDPGPKLFFQLKTRRHEHASTCSRPQRLSRSGDDIFGDDILAAALMDRLVHHCHRVTIRGTSCRVRQHRDL